MPSSPGSAESSSGANDEFFDVWLIKGIRIFWNFKTKTPQKKYLVSWLGYPWWHDTWEPRENIGEGCDDLVAHIDRAAALGQKPAVGTEWLASENWLKMVANSRLQSSIDPGTQAKINEARRLEEEDREQGNPMGIENGGAIYEAAKQNLIDYEKYKAERNRRKQRPPTSSLKAQPSVGITATNKEYRRWFRGTRRSTRAQGYFHYSGDDQELAEMTSFTIPDDSAITPKVIRRFVSSGKAPVSRASTSGNKKRRRNAEPNSGGNGSAPSVVPTEASEASESDLPLVRLTKRKPRAPVPRSKKKKATHVEGPPKKKQRVDSKPKLPTPPPDSETSDAEAPLSKQRKSHVIQSSSDEGEPLAIQAGRNRTQMTTTDTHVQITPLNILNQPTPTLQPNPKATLNPNLVSTRPPSGPRAQAKRSATGRSLVTTQNNPPLASYLSQPDSGPIIKGGEQWVPLTEAFHRKQYVGTSSKQQGPSLGTRARMLGEAPAVGHSRQVSRPSNTTTATKAPKPGPASSRSGLATSTSQPSKSTENNEEEDLFGDNELEENEQPADDMEVEIDFTIDISEPVVVESPPPKPSGPAPAVASKAVQLEVEATSFLTGVMAEVAPSQLDSPRSEPQKGPRRIGLYLGSPGCERLCEVYLANVSTSSLPSAHLSKWIFRSGENHTIYLDKLYSASHAPLILPAFEPLQWARLSPWDEADTRHLSSVKDWLGDANKFAILKLPNKPGLFLCIFSPRCKPFFDIFPNANPNYQEDQGLVLVLLKLWFDPPRDARPRETPERLLGLPREVLYQDPDISRGLMLLNFTQSTLEMWQAAWRPGKKPLLFSLFTMETILFRAPDQKYPERKPWHGDQLPAHEHAAWRLKHQPETKALLKILELTQLKPWHLMERTDVTFIHNNSWEFLKKLPGLNDRLGRPYTQFFAFGPHHSLSPDKWGVREVFMRGAVVTFTARSIAENGETFKKLVERTHKSPISVAYVTPLTVALVEQMVTDVQFYPNNLESLMLLLDAILDSRISLTTAPPHSWKHDDMNEWRDMQFTFGADESQLREPIPTSASSLDQGTATPPQYRTHGSILTACAKELEAIQWEQPIARNDEIDAGFRQLGRAPPPTTTKDTPKTALQLEADVNTSLYSDLRLMQSNPFYHTEYRHFVVVESKNTMWAKEKGADSVEHLTADEALRLVDPVTQR